MGPAAIRGALMSAGRRVWAGRRRRRALRVTAAACAVAAAVWVMFGSWFHRQLRVIDVVAVALNKPGWLVWAVDETTSTPDSSQQVIASVPSTVVRPAGSGPWPAVVFVNGATAQGRHEPHVVRLGDGLARAGYLVVVPDLPGLRRGQITLGTEAALVAVARRVAGERAARGGRVGFLGVSVGASLALLAAERTSLSGHIAAVAGLAPYTDLEQMVRLATTGTYLRDGRPVRYRTGSFLGLALARSLVASMPASGEQRTLLSRLRAIPDNAADPLAGLRRSPADRTGPVGAVVALLANRDPRRFDPLWAALPRRLRRAARQLSPLSAAARLRVPVYLASSAHDEYFPPSQSEALAARAPDASVMITGTLSHVLPEPSLGHLGAFLNFDDFAVNSLNALNACATSAGCPR